MREGAIVDDKYRIIRKIGEGGMGSVWVARNEMTEREFAIKFMSAEFTHSQALTTRFLQEAKLAGRLRHPSLLEIFDAGVAPEFDGAPYLVMELLDGIPLDESIQKAGRLPVGIALELMCTVAHAMCVVHDKGIVHRDLKPANLFMHRPGTGAIVPKVLDFGISKVTSEHGHMQPSGLTQTGYVLGSPIYMSPEQASSDKTIDARSDIHALGVLLWECLVGHPPFSAQNYNTLVVEIMVNERPRLDGALPGASRSLAELVARAFALKRDDRFQTALALAEALEREMDRMGHVRVLDTRGGAAEFFSLLVRSQPEPTSVQSGSSTTSALAVPAKSATRSPALGSPASDPPAGTLVLHPSQPLRPSPDPETQTAAAVARSRWLIPLAIGATSVLVVGGVGIAWRLSLPTTQVTVPAADSSAVAPGVSPTPDVSGSEEAEAVAASASASVGVPPASAQPEASGSAARANPPALTTHAPRAGVPSATKSAKPPAHHGVEDDGL